MGFLDDLDRKEKSLGQGGKKKSKEVTDSVKINSALKTLGNQKKEKKDKRQDQGKGIGRSQQRKDGNDGGNVMVQAVAYRRNNHEETDVEEGIVMQKGLSIKGNKVIKANRRNPNDDDGGNV